MGGSSSDVGICGSVAASGSPVVTPSVKSDAKWSSFMMASNADRSIGPFSSSGSEVNTAVSSFTPVCSMVAPQNGQNLPAMGSSLPQFLQSMDRFLLYI